jgi:hypothetical protein
MGSLVVTWFEENRKHKAKKKAHNKQVIDLVMNALIDKAKEHGWEIDFEKPVELVSSYVNNYIISFYAFGKEKHMFIIRANEVEIANKKRQNLVAENCKSIW